jgi:hypothetical protein
MHTLRNLLIGAMGVAAATAAASSAFAADATASTAVNIVRPISIAKDVDLNFGTIIRPTANATVAISTAGVVSGATATPSSASPTAAKFTVSGEGGQSFSISETATLVNGTNSLTLTLSKAAGATGSLAGNVGTLSGALGDTASGTAELLYGASFPITPTTATGAYTGSLQVTVDYN